MLGYTVRDRDAARIGKVLQQNLHPLHWSVVDERGKFEGSGDVRPVEGEARAVVLAFHLPVRLVEGEEPLGPGDEGPVDDGGGEPLGRQPSVEDVVVAEDAVVDGLSTPSVRPPDFILGAEAVA